MTPVIEDYRPSLQSAKKWVAMQTPSWNEESFRSTVLLPDVGRQVYERVLGAATFASSEARSLVECVIENRKQQTAVHDVVEGAGGRLLRYNFCETTYSCTPRDETGGFFDELDLPPWDLWIAMAEGGADFLISWIPEELVQLADKGVKSSAEENILWLDARFTPSA